MTHLLFGATGLIGSHVAHLIPVNELIITVTRKPFKLNHINHQNIVNDMSQNSLENLVLPTPVDNVFCCLGTTIKIAGSQNNFYQVDHDLVVNVAKLANRIKSKKLLIISALGADPKSSVFYNRVKGEMEHDATAAAPDVSTIIFFRPSLLLGDRHALHQPTRLGEKFAIRFAPFYTPLFFGSLRKYCPISADQVAKKMLTAAHVTVKQNHVLILENKALLSDTNLTSDLR